MNEEEEEKEQAYQEGRTQKQDYLILEIKQKGHDTQDFAMFLEHKKGKEH